MYGDDLSLPVQMDFLVLGMDEIRLSKILMYEGIFVCHIVVREAGLSLTLQKDVREDWSLLFTQRNSCSLGSCSIFNRSTIQ